MRHRLPLPALAFLPLLVPLLVPILLLRRSLRRIP
jgi:hypothetical protein